jgi:hypothetical protein
MGRAGWGVAFVWLVVLGSFDTNSATWRRYAFEIPSIEVPSLEVPHLTMPQFSAPSWAPKFLRVDGTKH